MQQNLLKLKGFRIMLKGHFNCLKTVYCSQNCIIFLIVFMSLFATQTAFARLWKNSYVSFQLPDRWTCKMKQTEYICEGQRGI